MDESHRVVNSTDIGFNGLKNGMGGSKIINVSINNTIPNGEYNGRIFFVSNYTTSIPFKIATEPLLIDALLWVLVGILISVISWEVINHLTTIHIRAISKDYIESNKELGHKLARYEKRWAGVGLARQTIYIIGSAGFAMSVGIVSLFANDFVTGQRAIDFIDIIAFIGIGMGIGSIKEFVDRAS